MLRPFQLAAVALLLPLACAAPFRARDAAPLPAADAAPIAADVAWLADDAREGRGLGSPGLDASAAHLADAFRAAGLEPGAHGAGGAASYLQPLELPVSLEVTRAALRVSGKALARGRDFEPLRESASGDASGGLVFVGYGIHAPDLGWDDYAGVEVAGRVAVAFEGGPDARVPALDEQKAWPYRGRAHKLVAARQHGAVALLLVPRADAKPPTPEVDRGDPAIQASGTIACTLTRAAAERLFARAGRDLALRENALEQIGRPASAPLGGLDAQVSVRIERRLGPAANVVALRRGDDAAVAAEAVVIGAHYDHLGRGAFGSATPERAGEIHNGADDNASGTAGLLALARVFGALAPSRRTLVLVAFTGEEAGLLGSTGYVADPPWPLADTVAMLNLDMIGRLRDDTLTVYGTEVSPSFDPLVAQAVAAAGLTLRADRDPYAPSDQLAFAVRGIPALLFHTGLHPEYHTPDDDAPLVNAGGEARVVDAVARIARVLLDAAERPALAPAPPTPEGVVTQAAAPARRGYGPYLGTVPAFAGASERGVRLQGVRPGSPAAAAGLRAGDVIVSFDGTSVANLGELSALLFASKAGQHVALGIERDGAPLALEAVLGERR